MPPTTVMRAQVSVDFLNLCAHRVDFLNLCAHRIQTVYRAHRMWDTRETSARARRP